MANCIRCGRQLPPLTLRKICPWCVRHEAAQRGDEVDDRQPVITQPWVRRESSITLTRVIFGINVAVFLAMLFKTESPLAFLVQGQSFSGQISVPFGANFGPLTLSGDWWRLVTYMFLHGGIFHVAVNMWCLWNLGTLSEALYGRWTYLSIYLITGIAGGLASAAWNPRVLSVGASGALFGLSGALIASFYLGEFSLSGISIRGTLTSLLFFTGFSLYFGFVDPLIDNACHVGGLVSGLALGALIARFAPQSEAPLRRGSLVGLVALSVLACGLWVRHWHGGEMRLARQYQELSEKGDTIGRYKLIAKQEPNSVPVHMALAGAYFNQQQFPQAEAEYKRVLALQPEYDPAKFELGLTYLNERRHAEARAAFNDLLSRESAKPQAHYGLGLVFEDEGKYQAALEEFQAALPADPSMTDVYQELGNCYAQLKRYDDAIAAYLKEKDAGLDTPDLENALAEAYQAKGMIKEAQGARDRAQQLKSGTAH